MRERERDREGKKSTITMVNNSLRYVDAWDFRIRTKEEITIYTGKTG